MHTMRLSCEIPILRWDPSADAWSHEVQRFTQAIGQLPATRAVAPDSSLWSQTRVQQFLAGTRLPIREPIGILRARSDETSASDTDIVGVLRLAQRKEGYAGDNP